MVGSLALGARRREFDPVELHRPRSFGKLTRRWCRGDLSRRESLFQRWAPFRRFARRVGQPAAAKAAVDCSVRRCGSVRASLVPLTSVAADWSSRDPVSDGTGRRVNTAGPKLDLARAHTNDQAGSDGESDAI